MRLNDAFSVVAYALAMYGNQQQPAGGNSTSTAAVRQVQGLLSTVLYADEAQCRAAISAVRSDASFEKCSPFLQDVLNFHSPSSDAPFSSPSSPASVSSSAASPSSAPVDIPDSSSILSTISSAALPTPASSLSSSSSQTSAPTPSISASLPAFAGSLSSSSPDLGSINQWFNRYCASGCNAQLNNATTYIVDKCRLKPVFSVFVSPEDTKTLVKQYMQAGSQISCLQDNSTGQNCLVVAAQSAQQAGYDMHNPQLYNNTEITQWLCTSSCGIKMLNVISSTFGPQANELCRWQSTSPNSDGPTSSAASSAISTEASSASAPPAPGSTSGGTLSIQPALSASIAASTTAPTSVLAASQSPINAPGASPAATSGTAPAAAVPTASGQPPALVRRAWAARVRGF